MDDVACSCELNHDDQKAKVRKFVLGFGPGLHASCTFIINRVVGEGGFSLFDRGFDGRVEQWAEIGDFVGLGGKVEE